MLKSGALIVSLFSLTHSILVAETGEWVHDGNDKSSRVATKDDINYVLDLVKLQGQRISNLENEVKMKNEALDRYGETVRSLEKTVLKQSKKISELDVDVRESNVKIKELERTLIKLYGKKCGNNCFNFESGFSSDTGSKDRNIRMKQGDASSKEPLSQIVKPEMQEREIGKDTFTKRTFSSHVSFSVYLSHLQEHLGAKQVVKFDRVITNDGNAYNSHTGVFTVPVTGTYMLIFYVSSSDSKVEFDLMVDDSLKTSGVARPTDFSQDNDVQGGGAVILHLNQGVSVWIQNTYAESIVWSSYSHRWVTFSGFLIY